MTTNGPVVRKPLAREEEEDNSLIKQENLPAKKEEIRCTGKCCKNTKNIINNNRTSKSRW